MSSDNPHRPDCPAAYSVTAPCLKNCESPTFRRPLTAADYEAINPTCEHGIVKGLITCPRCQPEEQAAAEAHARRMMRDSSAVARAVDTSTPEQPGTAIFHATYAPDGSKTAVIITRADRYAQVSREALVLWADDMKRDAAAQTITMGYPDSVTYHYLGRFDDHTDLYERLDGGETAATDETVTDLDPVVAELLASNQPKDTEPAEVAHGPGREKGFKNPLQPRVDELTRVLNDVLRGFTEKGHPGEECLRAGWTPVAKVAEWRRVAAGKPSFDELFEQLSGVELTDWQRAMVRDVWIARESGRRGVVTFSREQGGDPAVREALRQLIELSQRHA